ncbi:hypothetical protein [Amycolatopsis sp. GM8]|uniref:hypothetical protein n=1 Tax=Amycolatopsis sp. GM8 TaxID=2896530 RepID=UPI001F35342D|nr:hypothetical protein [Amycolatopsis sp. GM8]
MSKEIVGILLLAVAGFLAGGVYSTYKTAKGLAIVLLVAALIALGGGIVWFVS